jgi:nucleotidyltransferase substrate binding protein (TIGR01987 family)
MSDNGTKRDHFHQANQRLQEGVSQYDRHDDLQRDGLLQRFEFTFELAWKVLRDVFASEGLIGLNSPKSVLREAYAAGLVEDQDLWLLMLEDRNATTHLYEKDMAVAICDRIIQTHRVELALLEERISRRMEKGGLG